MSRWRPLMTWVRTNRWPAVVLVAALGLVALNGWWLLTYRQGEPLDIDEAGYITIALGNHAALSTGLSAYWSVIQSQSLQAPLVPALTAIVYTVHQGILISYTVELAFLVVLGVATYGVARYLAGPKLGALAALVTLTAPGTIAYSREYIFALPAAALVSCSLYALLRSDGLRSRRWALLLGAGIAAGLLARTMTVAFVPALVVAALVRIGALPEGRRRALVNLAAALAVAAGLAALWYARNVSTVYRYLVDYGYGRTSNEYGVSHPITSLAWWTSVFHTAAMQDLDLPLACAVLAGLVAVAFVAARRLRASADRPGALIRLASSDALTVAIMLAGSYLALSSSTNEGSGFTLVMLGPAVALAVLPLHWLPSVRVPVIVLLAAIALVNLLASTDLWRGFSTPRSVDVPVLGSVPVVDPQAEALKHLRVQLPGDPTRFSKGERAWPRLESAVAGFLIAFAHAHGYEPIVAFGARNRVFNTNTVGLAASLYYDTTMPTAQLDPRFAGDQSSAYAAYLDAPEHGQPNFLVTIDRVAGDYTPVVSPAAARAAALADGFVVAHDFRLPDDRVALIWWLPRGPVLPTAP